MKKIEVIGSNVKDIESHTCKLTASSQSLASRKQRRCFSLWNSEGKYVAKVSVGDTEGDEEEEVDEEEVDEEEVDEEVEEEAVCRVLKLARTVDSDSASNVINERLPRQ